MSSSIDSPILDSDEGAVARLSLAEARGPGDRDYNESQSHTCLQRFKLVLKNRLLHNPSQFKAPGTKNLRDIIKARDQFGGFEKYPVLSKKILERLKDVTDVASDANDLRHERYRNFLSAAVAVANAPVINDLSSTGLFGWRTQDRGPPGPRFKPFDTLGGITFYTLAPTFLSMEDSGITISE